MRIRLWLLLPIVVLLLAALVLHFLRLDVLLWQSWRLSSQALPEQALNLARYRVDIEALPVAGIDDDLSALTFNSQTGTLWSVLNGEPLLVELSTDGRLLRSVRLEGVSDMEGLTHVEGRRFVIAEERSQRLILLDLPDEAQVLDVSGLPSLSLGLDGEGNKGFEGLSWDERQQRLLVVRERDPLRVLEVRGFVDADPQTSLRVEVRELKPSDSPTLFMRDLSSLTWHAPSGHLLLLSDESHMLVEYAADGQPLSLLGLWRGMAGLRRTVPQAEGVTVGPDGAIYLVSEPNLFYRFTPQP
ncbi:SdiA-regulated domain-containing protein [Halopseudomonas yangmingensis]|uniref:Uncharacterized protein YjiK n=1 Tax=Halopseudomonas yangmingensis TaxID=1720063 RepID=A0A1I4THW6_9GAMM|nr:SdiA-regulated domain-containing protein [Halopseudomonas yangmingensis]SFM76255.1 Uncharacterized protein YjiK [Halopseudomonas yangmingensis]